MCAYAGTKDASVSDVSDRFTLSTSRSDLNFFLI